jgi:hypothetical protein
MKNETQYHLWVEKVMQTLADRGYPELQVDKTTIVHDYESGMSAQQYAEDLIKKQPPSMGKSY